MTPTEAKKMVMDRLAPTIIVVRYGKNGFLLATSRLYEMIFIHDSIIFGSEEEAQGYADDLNAAVRRGELRI